MTEILSIARELVAGTERTITRIRRNTAGRENEYEQVIREQPLLDELADYVAGAARTGAARSGAGYGSRMLISSDALEVQQHIEHTVADYGVRGDLKGQVMAWASACASGDEYQQVLALQTLARWREQIQGMRYSTHELTAPCPMCRCEQVREKSTVGGGHVRRVCVSWRKRSHRTFNKNPRTVVITSEEVHPLKGHRARLAPRKYAKPPSAYSELMGVSRTPVNPAHQQTRVLRRGGGALS